MTIGFIIFDDIGIAREASSYVALFFTVRTSRGNTSRLHASVIQFFFTMKRLVSKNRSTQFAKQLSSPRENRVEGVPVMHLSQHMLVNV